jgi:hypothetical protein
MRAPDRLIDTSALAPREREAAARAFLETLTDVDVVGHSCPPDAVRTRLSSWDLRHFQLNVLDSPWLSFGLHQRSTMEAISIGTQLRGRTVKTIGEHCQTFAPGQISLTDFARPYQWRSVGDGATMSLRFSYAELCLPAEQIRSAPATWPAARSTSCSRATSSSCTAIWTPPSRPPRPSRSPRPRWS